MAQSGLAERIERELETVGIHLAVQEIDNAIVLGGMVRSEGDHAAALEVAGRLAGDRRIEDGIEVMEGALDQVENPIGTEVEELRHTISPREEPAAELRVGLPYEPSAREPPDVGQAIEEGEEPYTPPPTDPVTATSEGGRPEVLGGLSPSSMDSVEVESSALDDTPGDEAIAEAIRRELREDAATTDLDISVHVRNRVVRLRGTVPGPEDVGNVEEVAGRIPGVREVVEELDIRAA